jgi:NADP-dependent aldehyde dehydrogenase
MANLHGKSLVAGEWVSGGDLFHARSPLNGEKLEPGFFTMGPAQVDAALQQAEAAFKIFGASSGDDRGAFLERISDEIMALGDDLLARANLETGLPLARLTGERARTVNQLRLFAQVAREGSWVDARIDHAMPDRQPVPKPDLRRMLVPLGPVAVFGSSNFPLAFSVAGGDTASALATGNPVIVKAHSGHPGTSEMVAGAVAKALAHCGLPGGVFSMLQGPGRLIGPALVKHPFTRAAGFTGSRSAGRALFDAAASRPDPIPVFAEMSSLNPVFLLPEALRRRGPEIARGLCGSITMGVGQFCTKPGLVFGIRGPDLDLFQQALAKALESVPPATMLHVGICDAYRNGLARATVMQGVEPVAKSNQTPDAQRTQAEAVVARTTLENFLQQPALAEEVFGPFALVIVAGSLGDFERAACQLEGQLTATLHGTDADLAGAQSLVQILQRKAGRLIVNGFPTGVEVCPSMNHGGPYPATTDVRFTSVGTAALQRFVRPVCYQDFPQSLLPACLREDNPLHIQRMVDGRSEPAKPVTYLRD